MCLATNEEAAEQFNGEILDLMLNARQQIFMRDGARSIPFRAENSLRVYFKLIF